MAVTATVYAQFLLDLGMVNGMRHVFPYQDFKVALITHDYVPNYNTNEQYIELTDFELIGSGYTTGGILLDNVTWTFDTATRSAVLNADPIGWTLTGTFRYAVVYNNSSGYLIGAIDFGEDKTYAAEAFDMSFDDGVVAITAG